MTDTALVTRQHGAIEEVRELEKRIVDFLPGAANVPHEIRMALAQIAIAHHLDPFLKEVVPIPRKDREGRIVGWDMFIGIAGWRNSAHRTNEFWGRRFERVTDEERRMAGAGPNDLMIKCLVLRRRTGQQPMEFDGYGIVGADERSKMNKLQLVRLRAERDAMKAAFPISAPPGVRVIDDEDHSEVDRGPSWEVVEPEAQPGRMSAEMPDAGAQPAAQPIETSVATIATNDDSTIGGNGSRKQSWPAAIVQAVLKEGLAANPFEAVGMLNKSNVITPATEFEIALTWCRVYRSLREAGNEPDQAAAAADGAETEMATEAKAAGQ